MKIGGYAAQLDKNMSSSSRPNSSLSTRHSLHLFGLRGSSSEKVPLTKCPSIRLGNMDHFGLDFVGRRSSLIVENFSHELSFPHTSSLMIESTTSPAESALIESGFSKQAAVDAAPWLLATSFHHFDDAPVGTQFFTVKNMFPRAIIRTNFPSHPTPTRELVDTMMLSSLEVDKLRDTFHRFGHVIPSEVWLGGAIVTTVKILPDEFRPIPEETLKMLIKIAFEAKLGICRVSEYSLDGEEILIVEKVRKKMVISVLGGLAGPIGSRSSLGRWIKTLEEPKKWEAIRVNHMFAVADLLKHEYPAIYDQVIMTLGPVVIEEEMISRVSAPFTRDSRTRTSISRTASTHTTSYGA